uniref:Uncharacterized protein MANES_18G058200 n=1 Tax=Rhizophora mucronata TaxID=61149 RepID=A0A2P2MDM6_RHIMU
MILWKYLGRINSPSWQMGILLLTSTIHAELMLLSKGSFTNQSLIALAYIWSLTYQGLVYHMKLETMWLFMLIIVMKLLKKEGRFWVNL